MQKHQTLNQRRWQAFCRNKRGFYSLLLFIIIFIASMGANLITNDSPLLIQYRHHYYFPLVKNYPETTFGGDFLTYSDYRDPLIIHNIAREGWALWPPFHFSYDTIDYVRIGTHPAPPSKQNIFGTDDQGRDVFARLLYGLRLSILFGFILTIVSSIIGVIIGAVQGYFGGWIDLLTQRFLEIWSGLPQLLILIIVASVIAPGFFTLLLVLTLFSWTTLVAVVRAEFMRTRNFDYVRAAQALGMGHYRIMMRHILPNALVATLTYLPFILSSSVIILTSLDFLGLGLPPGSASLGDLLRQGKGNLQAPWLGITGFLSLSILLSLLIFVGEAVRDAFDPRKNNHG